MKEIKMVVSDLDHTLIPSEHALMSKRMVDCFDALAKRDITFMLNTGRHYSFLSDELKAQFPEGMIGTINGACLVNYDGSIVCKHELRKELFEKLITLADTYEIGLGFKFSDAVVSYANYQKFIDGYCNGSQFRIDRVINNDLERNHHLTAGFPLGVFIITEDEVAEICRKEIPELTFAWSQFHGFDVYMNDMNKSIAVEEMLDRMHLTWENVMAFGDAPNDIPMIVKAGIGVAMGNAKEIVKNKANLIAPECKDDGVAQIIENLLCQSKSKMS